MYAKDDAVDDLFQLQKRYQRIVYSGLTDRIMNFIEFTLPKRYRVRKESVNPNAVCHIENNVELFNLGNVGARTMFGNEVICYSREKMIVEMIRKRDDYYSELFLKAVKTFFKGKDKKIWISSSDTQG